MTPLQEAAKAARDVLALPMCDRCVGRGDVTNWEWTRFETVVCPECDGCGVDTANPDALTGRSMRWLQMTEPSAVALIRNPAGQVFAAIDSGEDHEDAEHHDGTPEGVATACLRLVARCPA